MHISSKGVRLIVTFEGCHLEAYKCPAGKWTIGYGHTKGVKPGQRLKSEKEARELLRKDLKQYEGYVNKAVEDKKIGFKLNQNQFDALTSFVYNLGYENLLQLVTNRDEGTIAEKMLYYYHAGGKELEGLKRRREAEQKLFLTKKRRGKDVNNI